MKYSELEKKLKAAGCRFERNGKRHPLWYSPNTGNTAGLSYHRSEEVASGTLKDILTKMGVTV